MAPLARPSLQPPESIKPSLFFTADRFVASAQADIGALAAAFESAWAAETPAAASPFTVFKAVYEERGWPFVHLGVVDPALRRDWFDVLTRLFLETARDDPAPLKRAAALFGLYCLWATQPDELGPRYSIRIDIPTYHIVKGLPLALVTALERPDVVQTTASSDLSRDAGQLATEGATQSGVAVTDIEIDPRILHTSNHAEPGPATLTSQAACPNLDMDLLAAVESSTSLRPTHDLLQILEDLDSVAAWTWVPETVWAFPKLPTSYLVESTSKNGTAQSADGTTDAFVQPEWGNDILATRAELAHWASGKGFLSTSQAIGHDLAQDWQRRSMWNPSSLVEAKEAYLSSKALLDPDQKPHLQFSTMPVALKEEQELQKEVLKGAVGMTMRVMKPAGQLMAQLLPNDDNSDVGVFRMVRRTGNDEQDVDEEGLSVAGEWSEAATMLEAAGMELEAPL